MPRTGLTTEELKLAVLDAAEATIRRHGAEKSRLVDVAKSVGVNHAMLYRIFADKDALMDAVSERWLNQVDRDLADVLASGGLPRDRLRRWFLTLHGLKRDKVLFDPELYAAFNLAAVRAKPFVQTHLKNTMNGLISIVTDGANSGAWNAADPVVTAQTIFDGMLAFHHPRLVLEGIAEDRTARLEAVLELLLAGMESPQIQ